MAMEDLTSDDQTTDLTSEDQTGQLPSTTEQDAAPSDEDAAMEQAFNDVRGVETPAPAPVTEEPPPPAAEPPPPEPEASPAPPPVDLAKLQATVQALEQREGKVFGALGAMKQAIDALKSPQRTAASTKVTAAALKRLSQEFPQLAEYLAEDLNEVLQGGQPATPPSTEPAPATAAPATPAPPPVTDGPDPVTRQAEMRVVDGLHPGWKDKVRSTEFQGWLATKPEAEQTKFLTSWSADDVIGTLKAFDDWTAEAARAKQSKQQRLEAAVAPRGNPQQAPAQTEDDAFEEGFRSVRGRT
jgi:hypothetical protein